jgi:hypothetical protein
MMRVVWQITKSDVAKVKELVEAYRDNPCAKERIERNRCPEKPKTTKAEFWKNLMAQ